MAPGTVVIEAGQRSGALNTARHARDLGRILMAVPGPVTSDLSAGCHFDHQELAGDARHQRPGGHRSPGRGAAACRPGQCHTAQCRPGQCRPCPARGGGAVPGDVPVARSPRDQVTADDRERAALDGDAAAVLDALPARGCRSTDEIAVRAGLPPRVVLAALAMLRVHGLAERVDGGWRLRRAG